MEENYEKEIFPTRTDSSSFCVLYCNRSKCKRCPTLIRKEEPVRLTVSCHSMLWEKRATVTKAMYGPA